MASTLAPPAPPLAEPSAGEVAPTEPTRELDESVSFPELVWAHFVRQKELHDSGGIDSAEEQVYRERLKRFKDEHGELVNAYWCRYEASAAAVTERRKRLRWLPWRRESIIRLHTATDWRTRDVPEIASLLHSCESLGIRVGEVLRETSERIALQWILAVASRLLGFVDRPKGVPLPDAAKIDEVVKQQQAELQRIESYYHRAGNKAARLVYFHGMMQGVALLAGLLGVAALVMWAFDGMHPRDPQTQEVFVVVAMGAIGAVVSVMSRMAAAGRFQLDHEVGRKPIRRLGSFRPFIGGIFALALYLALSSDLLQVGAIEPDKRNLSFYATVAFLAGFSERWTRMVLSGAMRTIGDAGDATKQAAPTPRKGKAAPAEDEATPDPEATLASG